MRSYWNGWVMGRLGSAGVPLQILPLGSTIGLNWAGLGLKLFFFLPL